MTNLNGKNGDFEILIKLMMMATSDNDGEALTALRKANAKLAAINRNWEELLRGKVAISDFPEAPPMGGDLKTGGGVKYTDPFISTMFDDIFKDLGTALKGGGGFRDFITDVHRFWEEKGFLTEKQYAAVKKSWDNTQRRGRR
jgi:hypothetical protein